MRNRNDRIEVFHVGSLPRTDKLREANKKRLAVSGELGGFDQILADAIVDVLQKQKKVGVTVPSDGEYGQTGPRTFSCRDSV